MFYFFHFREKEYESVKLTIALKENNLKKETIIESLKKEVCVNLSIFLENHFYFGKIFFELTGNCICEVKV